MCDLLLFDKVALEKNQNNADLTLCSPGKLLVHVLEKAMRTPHGFQLSCMFDNLHFYLLVQLFSVQHQKVQTSLVFIQTCYSQEGKPTQFFEGGHKPHMPHHYSGQPVWLGRGSSWSLSEGRSVCRQLWPFPLPWQRRSHNVWWLDRNNHKGVFTTTTTQHRVHVPIAGCNCLTPEPLLV